MITRTLDKTKGFTINPKSNGSHNPCKHCGGQLLLDNEKELACVQCGSRDYKLEIPEYNETEV